MKEEYAELVAWAKQSKKEIKKEVKNLKRKKEKEVEGLIHELHDEAFEKIDCLECANCCSTTSPIITYSDLKRMAKGLGRKPGDVFEEYLREDSDGDMVFKTAPCPFLGADKYCSIYEDRPKACREYPHTDRRKAQQIVDLHEKNTRVCPAVASVFKSLLGED